MARRMTEGIPQSQETFGLELLLGTTLVDVGERHGAGRDTRDARGGEDRADGCSVGEEVRGFSPVFLGLAVARP